MVKQLELNSLLSEVRQCRLCEAQLPLGPRPVVQCSTEARILIAGNLYPGDWTRKWLLVFMQVI